MSIDHFHFVKGETTTELKGPDAVASVKQGHSISVMWSGVEHLFFYYDGGQAASDFEEWRRQPCERITLWLDGVQQPGDRLSLRDSDRHLPIIENKQLGTRIEA